MPIRPSRSVRRRSLDRIGNALDWGAKRERLDPELLEDLGELQQVYANLKSLVRRRNARRLSTAEKEVWQNQWHRARTIMRNIAPKMPTKPR